MIVTWVVSYDAEALEPMLIAYRAGDGARLVRELHGADAGPEHGQMVVLLQHLERIAEGAPAALELPHELVAHVAELFAWAGATAAELDAAGIAGDALLVELGVWPEPARVIEPDELPPWSADRVAAASSPAEWLESLEGDANEPGLPRRGEPGPDVAAPNEP